MKSRNNKIPVFIISFDRLVVLKRTIESCLRYFDHEDLYIVDRGSTYEPLLEYYQVLKSNGANIIYSSPVTKNADCLNSIKDVIEEHKQDCKYYIVTDPDISLEDAALDAINVYIHILETFPEVDIVGPMLKIDDIPEDYPAREYCWKRHVEQFWHKQPKHLKWQDKDVYYQLAAIDTTFGVLRSSTIYQRKLQGARVYNPYEAIHLDWYVTESNITDDQKYYMQTSNSNVAHWSGPWFSSTPKEVLADDQRTIYIVDRTSQGNYVPKKTSLPPCNNSTKKGAVKYLQKLGKIVHRMTNLK